MDATQLLMSDHQKVKTLFHNYKSEKSRNQQMLIFGTIYRELTTHAFIEETVFYPACSQFAEVKDLIENAYDDHQEVKDILEDIAGLEEDSKEFFSLMTELMETVEMHVEEEELELFPIVRDRLSVDQLVALGEKMEAAQQDAPEERPAAA